MIGWTLIPEYMALLLILVIMLFFYDKRQVHTFRRSTYWACLWLSALTIVLNIASVYTIERAAQVPMWLNMALNSLYFWTSVLTCSTMAFYMFQRILEYVYDKHCLKRAVTGLSVVMIFYTGLILWNLVSGVVFSFDAQGNYQRGIFNRLGYLMLLIELIMLMICYVRNRKSVSADLVRVFQIIIPVVVAIALLQVTVMRSVLLNGTIMALADLIIFIGFQSRPIEQDSLTGAGSRKSFFDEVSLRTGSGQHYQVIVVALRNFSGISQKVGHKKGDDLLYQVARFLGGVHPEGRVYRTSNVEFAVLLPWHSVQEQEELLQKIMLRFGQTWFLEKDPCDIPFYAAAITYQGQPWKAEQVMLYLEYALDLAKTEDLTLVRFNEDVARRYQRREFLLDTMQRAIEDHRFQVWYQPVYHREKGGFGSAEALLRLTDYQGSAVLPGEFIPLAEEYGMIDALTWVVLEKVCALLASGAVPGLEQVSVNISMRQFLQRDLLERVEQMLRRHNVAPERLKFEITERVLLEDVDYIRETMERMKRHRISFYLDDFGTGYANFSSVLDLPFEVVKLDRSLLAEHPEKPKAQLLPGVLIPFFHSLGHVVVSEGVETREQAQWMLQCGADRLQGFYYARPMREEQLVELFQEQEKKKNQ